MVENDEEKVALIMCRIRLIDYMRETEIKLKNVILFSLIASSIVVMINFIELSNAFGVFFLFS